MSWDRDLADFRAAALAAIRETKALLLSDRLPLQERSELEGQVAMLRNYVSIADRFAGERQGARLH